MVGEVPMNAQTEFASWPAWHQERALLMHRIFMNVERRIKNGVAIPRVFDAPSRYHRRRFYQCDPSKRRHFAAGTLMQHFYWWRKHGRVPEALGLGYRSWNKGTT